MYPAPLQKLIEIFSSFPTVGPRTAVRFVFHLVKMPESQIRELNRLLTRIKTHIRLCSFCFYPFEAMDEREESQRCGICQDSGRDQTSICIVEKESDLEALEKTKQYRGLYFILGGTIGAFRKQAMEQVRLQELKERITNPKNFGFSHSFKEIILALNPTTEGEAATLYIERALKPLKVQLTRLGRGLPIGGELEYADEETIKNALEGRR